MSDKINYSEADYINVLSNLAWTNCITLYQLIYIFLACIIVSSAEWRLTKVPLKSRCKTKFINQHFVFVNMKDRTIHGSHRKLVWIFFAHHMLREEVGTFEF